MQLRVREIHPPHDESRARGLMTRLAIILALACVDALPIRADVESWPMLALDAARSGVSETLGGALDAPEWVASIDANGQPIEFVGQSGPVVWRDLLYALGESGGQDRLYAIDRLDGAVRVSAPIEPPALDSWSTPLVDEANERIVVASGRTLRAFDASTGAEAWSATLELDVVNASPLVTTDLGPADRLFITDSDGFFSRGGGHLYCINIDPRDETSNPFDPGEIIWQLPLNAASSGNSPAYKDGLVYVADSGDPNAGLPGMVRAFDATSDSLPGAAVWSFTNVINKGFFGGVSVKDGHAYAASFSFSGGQASANLVKLDASTGALVWSSPSNRTDSTPIVLDDGRVLLSSGLAGFGSLPSLQLFAPDGTRLWDTALATSDDANGNGVIEIGEFFAVGGWTHVPLVVRAAGGAFAYAGTPPLTGGFFGPNTDAHLVDLDLPPDDPGFVIESFDGAGSTPALADGVLYTIGAGGLHAFGDFDGFAPADVNTDCLINAEDLYAWESGRGARDVTGDGVVDNADREALIQAIRANEIDDVTEEQP